MSLINQVLQDLEKRQSAGPELGSLPPHVRVAQPTTGGATRGRIIWLIAGLALVALAAYLYYAYQRGSIFAPLSQPAPVPVVSAPPPTAPVVSAPPEIEAQFQPVSRLSDELARMPIEKPAPAKAARRPPSKQTPKPATAPTPSKPAGPESAKVDVLSVEPLAPAVPETTIIAEAPITADEGIDAANTIDKQMRDPTAQQRAELAFRQGAELLRIGQIGAAEAEFRQALKEDALHAGARQALLGLLLKAGRNNDAEQLLRSTVSLDPTQPRYAMMLARLEVARGDVKGSINTLATALPHVHSDAEFYGFLAALLQRDGRHREATDYYQAALHIVPGNGIWMMGLGISLRASNQLAEAREIFQRSLDTQQLKPELKEFVERQLRELAASKTP
jgi:MSHA biogenesis protein MshN